MVIKDMQYDFLGKNIIHVDLMRVNVDERVKVMVPLELKGAANAKGTHEGGMIEDMRSYRDRMYRHRSA